MSEFNLRALEPGDKVGVGSLPRGWAEATYQVRTVARVTATQIVLDDASGSRFRRDTGRGVGEPYQHDWLLPPDDPAVFAYKRKRAVAKLRETVYMLGQREQLEPDELLDRIEALVAHTRRYVARYAPKEQP